MSEAGFPVLLLLEGRRCTIVGGGRVAERKALSLIAAGGDVRVIAPELTSAIEAMRTDGELEVVRRAFEPGDLGGAFLVVGATDDAQVNEQVWQEAKANGQLINSVDDPPRCNFFLPAVVRSGALTVAISTGGKSPAMAARIRRRLAKTFGPNYGLLLDLLGDLRALLIARVPDAEQRKSLLYRLVDDDLMAWIERGGIESARQRAEEIVQDALAQQGTTA